MRTLIERHEITSHHHPAGPRGTVIETYRTTEAGIGDETEQDVIFPVGYAPAKESEVEATPEPEPESGPESEPEPESKSPETPKRKSK